MAIVNTGNSAGLNVRTEKSTSSTRLGIIDNGAMVNVVRCDATWAILLYNGTPAFVMHQYLTGTPTIIGDGLTVSGNAVVNTNSVNVRSGAGTAFSPISMLNKGTGITAYAKTLASDGYWYRIDSSADKWVRGDFLAPGGSGIGSGGESSTKSGSYTVGNIGKLIKTNVNVRSDASTSAATMGQFPYGTKFVISGTRTGVMVDGSTLWVSVYFGNVYGNVLTKFIHSSCIEDQGYGAAYDTKSRFLEIAKSQTNLTGALLGLGGDWCQNWMYWLAAATGRKPSKLPYGQSFVSGGLAYFLRIALGNAPQIGDWVYYTKTWNGTVPSHVGLVTSVNTSARTFGTHEGNIQRNAFLDAQSTLTVVGTSMNISYINGTGETDRYVLCFVRPSYT